jgi:hypothetical protein
MSPLINYLSDKHAQILSLDSIATTVLQLTNTLFAANTNYKTV